jgi:hypothetical protein
MNTKGDVLSLYPDSVHVFYLLPPAASAAGGQGDAAEEEHEKPKNDTPPFSKVTGILNAKPLFERFKHHGGFPVGLPHAIAYQTTPTNIIIDEYQRHWQGILRLGGDDDSRENHAEPAAVEVGTKRAREDEEEEEEERAPCAKAFVREDFENFMQFLHDNRARIADVLCGHL